MRIVIKNCTYGVNETILSMGISIIYEGFAVEPKNVTEYGFCHRHSILSHDCVCWSGGFPTVSLPSLFKVDGDLAACVINFLEFMFLVRVYLGIEFGK